MLTGPTAAPAAWRSGTPGPVLLRPMLSTADIHFTPHIISTAYTSSHRESGYYRESSFQLSIITFICLVNVSRSRAVCIVPQSRHYAGLLRDKIVLCFMPFPLQSSPVDPSCECLHDGCHFVFIFPLTSPGDHQAPAQRPGSGAKTVVMV